MLKLIAVGLLVAAVFGLFVYGSIGPRCSWPAIVVKEWILRSPGPAEDVNLYLYRIHDSRLLDRTLDSRIGWRDVQTSRIAVVPELHLVIAREVDWDDQWAPHLSRLEQAHESARRSASHEPFPRFLLYQIGGGVGGLTRQVLLAESGEVYYWEESFEEPHVRGRLPESRRVEVSVAAAGEILDLAAEAEFPRGAMRFEWRCGYIDGTTLSLTFFDGADIGRVHYVNHRVPAREHAALIERMTAFVGP